MNAFCVLSCYLRAGACLFFPISTPRCGDRGRNHSRPAYLASDYYGNVAGLGDCGYRAMPRVEQTLESYLSPGAASSLKACLVLQAAVHNISTGGQGVHGSGSGWCVSALYVSVTGISSRPAKRAR